MSIEILPTRDLLGVYRDDRLAAPSTYWRNLCFNGTPHFSTRQEIVFEKIKTRRKLAPFVLPQNQGRPIYTREGSEAESFKPAYIKPKDAVSPGEHFDRQPGNLFDDTPRTPQQNADAEIAKIMAFHRDTIDRRWEWLAAQASLYGEVLIEYEDGPSKLVDFRRDPGHTVIKQTGFWSDPNHDIVADIQAWSDTMTVADFGGIPNRITVGAEVWAAMRVNTKLLELMDTTVKNSDVDLRRGLVQDTSREATVRFVGRIGTVEVYVYNDFYQNDAGQQVPFMNPKDVVLTTPDVGGVPAFGAILDFDANLNAVAVFPKMWKQEDPSGIFIMTQSAPLFIPVYPNRTFRARVLEEDSE